MFTQCPQCDAIFQLSASQLKAANGEVRCGQCLSVFNALNHLSEEIPQTQETKGTDNIADDASQYRDGNEEVSNSVAAAIEQVDVEETGATTDDVFSSVIAEASTHEIPAEEIDSFEEFLATDGFPDETSPTEDAQFAKDALPTEFPQPDNETQSTENPATTTEPAPNENAAHIETTSLAEDDTAPSPGLVTTLNTEFTNTFSVSETDAPVDETSLGDIDAVTTALDAKISINDDEFAELDAYLNGAEEEYAQDVAKRTDDTNTDDDDKIIIEAADLEPVTSPDYADTLDTLVALQSDNQSADNAATAEAETTVEPETETKPSTGNDTQTVNIPSLILDDLHAAKAEQLRPSNTPWIIGSLILMLTLVLQVAYHSRDALAKDTSLRPWLIKMCNIANCTLSQPYDIRQIEIIGRDVRSHPTARKSLVVSTTLINNATFVQPFPLLTMVFSDINGTKIAQRRFTPREYLHNSIDLAAGMTPDMPVRVELELVDPGKAAINYEFHAEVDPRRTRPLS